MTPEKRKLLQQQVTHMRALLTLEEHHLDEWLKDQRHKTYRALMTASTDDARREAASFGRALEELEMSIIAAITEGQVAEASLKKGS